MIELPLSKSIWNETDRRVAQLPVFNNSHRKVAANIVGCLGEVVVEKWLKNESVDITPQLTQTTHDYRLATGKTIDVKTKDRTVAPRSYYDCSVPLYNHAHQRPDYYIFVSLQRDSKNKSNSASRYHTAFILGAIDQPQLHKLGTVWKKGQTDPANGTKFWTDCINVHISDLTPYEVIADGWWEQQKNI